MARTPAFFRSSSFDQRYTNAVRIWLDNRFSIDANDEYVAHEPIWGIPSKGRTEGGHARRAARIYDVISIASTCSPTSLLDVGGAEGYLAWMAQKVLGAEVMSADISPEACARAKELCGVPSISVNASVLPFDDDSFDVVTITEVIEHLVNPVGALLEARRVAKKMVIASTEEFSSSEAERQLILDNRSLENHGERNVFVKEDFDALFDGMKVSYFQQRFAPEADISLQNLEENGFADWLVGEMSHKPGGGLVVACADGYGIESIPRASMARMADVIIAGVDSCSGGESPQIPGLTVTPREIETQSGAMVLDAFCDLPATVSIKQSAESLELSPDVTEQLLALNQKLELLPQTERMEWGGEEIVQGDQWSLENFRPCLASVGTTDGDDPQWVSPYLCIPNSEIGQLIVDFEIDGDESENCLQAYFQFANDMKFTQDNCVSVSFNPVPEGNHFEVPIPTSTATKDSYLVRVRIDPVLTGDNIRIKINSVAISQAE